MGQDEGGLAARLPLEGIRLEGVRFHQVAANPSHFTSTAAPGLGLFGSIRFYRSVTAVEDGLTVFHYRAHPNEGKGVLALPSRGPTQHSRRFEPRPCNRLGPFGFGLRNKSTTGPCFPGELPDDVLDF